MVEYSPCGLKVEFDPGSRQLLDEKSSVLSLIIA